MNVSLTPQLEQFITDEVATGRYASASEVVRAAVRTFQEEGRWKTYAREKVALGMEDVAAGRTMTSEQFLARIEERKRKRA